MMVFFVIVGRHGEGREGPSCRAKKTDSLGFPEVQVILRIALEVLCYDLHLRLRMS